jgi:ligand-binding sensor domain-containing protein/signal transduction histidine kinase/DNA-binding response OmpR family regulator
MRTKYILVYLLLFFAVRASAQTISFSSLGIADGLSQNSVLAICQDKDGFIWLGTRAGLNRYDSYNFKVYLAQPGSNGHLNSGYVTSLNCDSKNRLWIGTTGGLNTYDRVGDKFKKVPLPLKDIRDGNRKRINSILEDRSGQLWVASEFNLNVILPRGERLHIVPVPLPKGKLMLRSLFQDHKGTIWLGSTNGIYTIKKQHGQFQATKLEIKGTAHLAEVQIAGLVEDSAHNIWIGTLGKGLFKYDPILQEIKRFNARNLDDDNIRRLLCDRKGNLWIGAQNGVSVLNLTTNQLSTYRNHPWDNKSLSQNSVHSLFQDQAGTIWIGTFFGGVNKVDPSPDPFKVLSNRSLGASLNSNVVSSVVHDPKGNLWIGTEGGGINVLQPNGKIKVFQHIPDNPNSLGSNLVKVIFKDRHNDIWVGTHGGGLNLYHADTKGFKRYLNDKQATLGSEITSLMEDQLNRLWVGTETAGLHIFEKRNGLLVPVSNVKITKEIENRSILAIIQASDGKVWAGSPDGLYITDGRQQSVKTIKKLSTGQLLSVNCIFEDEQHHIWVGTNALGLLKFSSNYKLLARYTFAKGLSEDKVLGILQHKDDLWISTGNGLNSINLKNNKINIYYETDGLAGNAFNNNSYYKANNGRLYFGGYNGLTHFDPSEIKLNQLVPVAKLTSLSVHNKPITTGGPDGILPQNITITRQITLNYDQNVFTLRFAVLNFIKSKKNSYKYYLEGYDKSWQNTDIPAATYTNVQPGSYRFHIKGSNNDNVWSNEAVIKVNIKAPFWKTWWAYLLYFLFATGLILLLIRYIFIRTLYKKEQELTRLKLNFFTNISHEIRTHLALIIGPADKLIADNASQIQGKQQLFTIKNNSESLLQLINELLDFRKAETGHLSLHAEPSNLIDFIQTVMVSFNEIAVEKKIHFELQSSADHVEVYFDREQFEKVCYNLLHNAFKFTPDGGFVKIIVRNESHTVAIDVVNSGPGISRENIDKLFDNYFQEADGKRYNGYGIGLALSKSIMELHKGNIQVESLAENDGQQTTTFTVTLKKGSTHLSPQELAPRGTNHDPVVKTTNLPQVQSLATEAPKQFNDELTAQERAIVLVIEDNLEIRTFIKETLQSNYNVMEADNGAEGFDLAVLAIPDLIISDVMMPEMDGLTLCKKLKTDERTSHIQVILLTAKNSMQHQIEGLQHGADIYLTKPFSIEVLMLQTNNLLRARKLMWKQFERTFKPQATAEDTMPDLAAITLHPLDEIFLDRLTNLVNENLTNRDFGVQLLSKMAGMSQPVLFRKIKGITGISANEFVKSLRLKRATELLLEKRYNVSEISTMVGYESTKYFSREFKKHYGVNPSAFPTA